MRFTNITGCRGYMDVKQLSTQPAGGELQTFGGGSPLGSSQQESGFSTILQALSYKPDSHSNGGTKPRAPHAEHQGKPSSTMPAVSRAQPRQADSSKGAKSRTPQAKDDDKPSSATPAVSRSQSRKTDGNKGAKSRAPEAEADDKPSSTAPAVQRAQSRKANDSIDAESDTSQSKTDDQPATTQSDASTTLSQATPSEGDSASLSSQAETGDDPSMDQSGVDPLLLSLLGAAVVPQAPMVVPTPVVAETDTFAAADHGDEFPGVSTLSTTQPIVQPSKVTASPLGSETLLSGLAGPKMPSVMENAVAASSQPMTESQPLPTGTDRVAPVVEQSDSSQPLTALQAQEAERSAPQQGMPVVEQQKEAVVQTPVAVGQAAVTEQEPAKIAAPVTTQQSSQTREMVAAQPDRSQSQQVLGKGELSLHQQNMPSESSETQAAAALSGRMQGGGQGFNAESDGQRKEEGLKWFSRADLQSAEVSSRRPEPSAVEPLDAGRQDLSAVQGQGGTPSTSKSAPAPAVSLSSQANRLGPDPEAAPVPATHTVQFDLAPADFGQLRVRLVLADQTVHTHMSTDRAELGQMLTSQQEQLSTQLSGAGLDLGRFQVQVDQERSNQSGQEWQSQAQGGTSQQQRDQRQQDRTQDAPVPAQARTGMLSLFA